MSITQSLGKRAFPDSLLGKSLHEIINIFPKTISSGRKAGKIKYFMKSLVPFSSGKEEVQVYGREIFQGVS